MKILALLGSPRKKGNTDLLADAFLRGAESAGAQTEKVYLNDLQMRGCQACLSCHKTGQCKQEDDMTGLYEKLLAADLWLLATPVYWWGPSAAMKAVIDRWYCLCFGDNPPKIAGKKIFLISAFADMADEATPLLLSMLRKSTGFMKMEWTGEILVQALKRGEVKDKPAELARAEDMGKSVCTVDKA